MGAARSLRRPGRAVSLPAAVLRQRLRARPRVFCHPAGGRRGAPGPADRDAERGASALILSPTILATPLGSFTFTSRPEADAPDRDDTRLGCLHAREVEPS